MTRDPARGTCLNCDAPLGGAWCARGGQRDRDPDVSFRDLVQEAVEAFSNVDGSVLRSFRGLLWPPGGLTSDYLEGRRVRYLPPLRMYLLCSLAFVLGRGVRDWALGPRTDQLLTVTRRSSRTTVRQVIRGDSAVQMILDSTSASGSSLRTGAVLLAFAPAAWRAVCGTTLPWAILLFTTIAVPYLAVVGLAVLVVLGVAAIGT